jgi:transcriptional regulator with XRE-family HTH domain
MPTDDQPSQPPETLGGLIRAERQSQGLSMQQLGALVGVDKSMVLRWERDEWVPRAKHLGALSRALEIPTSDLMILAGVDYPHDAPSLAAMLRADYDLPPDAIREIERQIAKVARKYRTADPTHQPTKRRSHERRKP